MRVLDYLLENDWIQRADIDRLNQKSRVDQRRVGELEDEIGRLALVAETLLRVLEKKGAFSREEFRRLLTEVDREDGRVDGKRPPQGPLEQPPDEEPAH